MLYSITGIIRVLEAYHVVIECGQIGYSVRTSMTTLSKMPSVGETTVIYTYLHVKEDALELYGFAEIEELNLFKLLISVSGVGPKAAIVILSDMNVSQFALCVAAGDYKTITKVQGIGPKTAQRIILELKDKVSDNYFALNTVEENLSSVVSQSGNANEAVSALEALGYSRSDAVGVVTKMAADLSVEDMIKEGLKALSGKR